MKVTRAAWFQHGTARGGGEEQWQASPGPISLVAHLIKQAWAIDANLSLLSNLDQIELLPCRFGMRETASSARIKLL